jgi:hypothetical protein
MSRLGLVRLRNKVLRETGLKGDTDSAFLNELVDKTQIGFELEPIPENKGVLRGAVLFGEGENGSIIAYLRQLETISGEKPELALTLMHAARTQGYAYAFGTEKTRTPKNYLMVVSTKPGEHTNFSEFIKKAEGIIEIYCR